MIRKEWILPGIIIAFAAWPRFSNLTERGAFYHDEALTLQNGRYYGGLLRTAFQLGWEGNFNGPALVAEAKYQWHLGGTPTLHARPLHEGAVILLSFLGAEADTWALAFSALCALLSIFLLTRLSGNLIPGAGWIAAVLLALSAWHIHYSRAAVSMSLSLLLSLLALRSVLRFNSGRPEKSAAWTGFWCGLAILSHYNLLWLPMIAVLGAALHLRGLPWNRRLRSFAVLAGTTLVPALLLEGLWRQLRGMLGWALDSGDSSPFQNFSTYFEQLYAQVFNITTYEERHPLSPLFLPRVLLDLETVPMALLLLAGFGWLIYRAVKMDNVARILLAFALIPGIIWSLFGYHGPRSFISILPILCLGAGEMTAWTLIRVRRYGIPGIAAISVTALALIWWQGKSLTPLIQARSPWKDAAVFLQRHHPDLRVADTEFSIYNRPFLRYYLGAQVAKSDRPGTAVLLDPTAHEFPYGRHPHWETMRREGVRIYALDLDLGRGMVLLDPFSEEFISTHLKRGNPQLALYAAHPQKVSP